MASIFSKIISGEIPSYKIAEDENHIAFLDIVPTAKGHTLVVPKKEVDKIFDLSEQEYTSLMLFAHKVAKAIEKAVPCKRVGMSVIGLEVPHAHVHLIPLQKMSDINFENERLKLSEAEFKDISEKISQQL
ncbi:MAG: HIT family protein [Ichthyobacteriaceae bacterium]|nr:HIT family protein [Ichthyobacteriaceae bacterium]